MKGRVFKARVTGSHLNHFKIMDQKTRRIILRSISKGQQMLEPVEFETHNGLPVNRCQLVYNDSIIVTCSDDKTVGFWDSKSGACLHTLAGGHTHYIVDMDINETQYQLLTASWDKSAILWDYMAGQQTWSGYHESLVTSCAMHSNLVVTGCDDHHFYLYDSRSSGAIADSKDKEGHLNTVTCCRISRNGYSLCTCSMDRTALVWDLRMAKRLLKLTGHINVVKSCTFSNNDHYLCTASWDRSVRLYDIHSGSYRSDGETILDGHEGSVNGCCFSSDDSMLATCGCDQYVILWDMTNFELIGALREGSNTWLQDVHLSKCDKVVVTCSKEGVVRLWDTEAANKLYRRQNSGLNTAKCTECGCIFSALEPTNVPQLCVFCRFQSNAKKSIDLHMSPLFTKEKDEPNKTTRK